MQSEAFIDVLGVRDYKIIEGDQASKIAHKWLAIFCPHRTSFKGTKGGKTYLWNEIHGNFQTAQAIEQYAQHRAVSYCIIEDNFGECEKRIFVSQAKPIDNPKRRDFHVFPKNLAWSMAYTHEDGWIGPLFSKHPNYEKLNKENEKAYSEFLQTNAKQKAFR